MLTCLEIVNILYLKCVDLCNEIKYKYNNVFNNTRHRPVPYNYNSIYNNGTNYYTNDIARYNRDVVIDIDKQIVLETVNGPIFVNKNEGIISRCNLATISESNTLDTFTGELLSPKSDISDISDKSNISDWSVLTDDSN
jgi:hypothetical protein